MKFVKNDTSYLIKIWGKHFKICYWSIWLRWLWLITGFMLQPSTGDMSLNPCNSIQALKSNFISTLLMREAARLCTICV